MSLKTSRQYRISYTFLLSNRLYFTLLAVIIRSNRIQGQLAQKHKKHLLWFPLFNQILYSFFMKQKFCKRKTKNRKWEDFPLIQPNKGVFFYSSHFHAKVHTKITQKCRLLRSVQRTNFPVLCPVTVTNGTRGEGGRGGKALDISKPCAEWRDQWMTKRMDLSAILVFPLPSSSGKK